MYFICQILHFKGVEWPVRSHIVPLVYLLPGKIPFISRHVMLPYIIQTALQVKPLDGFCLQIQLKQKL